MSEINLGDAVRDIITGFEGIAISRQDGLFEGLSFKVQPRKLNDDHRPAESSWFEESRLELIATPEQRRQAHVEANKNKG